MNRSGRTTLMGLLPLFLLLAACTEPVVVIEEPAEVETCEWLIPIGIELVNDYYYTLLQTDLGESGGDPAQLPTSILALNARGADLDTRAAELECDVDQLNGAVAVATSGLESSDPVVSVFLETVRGGAVDDAAPYGAWILVDGTAGEFLIAPAADRPVTLLINEEAATGSSGCNDYYFPLITVDRQWTWDEGRPATSTELMCLDNAGEAETELAAFESTYLQYLGAVAAYDVDGNLLTLTGPEVELHFVRQVNGADSAGE